MTSGNLHDQPGGHVILLALLLASPFLAAIANAGEGWHCTAGVATAYRQDPANGRWKTLVFPVADQRFLVRPAAPGQWELVREGHEETVFPCGGTFDPAGLLRCGTGDQFAMNRDTLTFVSHLFAADNSDVEQLTAATVMGACTAL